MNDAERDINQFIADAIKKYPSKNEKTEYEKIMERATEEEKQLATEILREQGAQAKVDSYIKEEKQAAAEILREQGVQARVDSYINS